MVEALIDGHRDPEMLAGLAKGKMRSKIDALAQALAGNFDAHHAVAARQILDHIDFLTTSIIALDTEIGARLQPIRLWSTCSATSLASGSAASRSSWPKPERT
jgi:hypothetical protein